MTLDAVMAQLQHLVARLDTLYTELYQVNTHVGCIAGRQARLGGFVESPSPPLEAFETSEVDDDSDDDDDNEDGVRKSDFVSHTKHTAEATNINLFHS